jgi:hypothetical protein
MSVRNETYREKLSIDQIVLRHLDRKNTAASFSYESSVRQGLNNLPTSSRLEVLAKADQAYEEEKDTLVYKKSYGIKQGSENDPLVWNEENTDIGLSSDDGFEVDRHEDGTVDWNDERIISPILKIKTYTDYHAMDAVIMDAYQEAGLTFSQESVAHVRKYDYLMPPLDPKPRPLIIKEEENE